MASGAGGQIALMAAGSLFYSPNSSTLAGSAQWTNFVSESVNHLIEEITENAITGYRAKPPSYKGVENGAGDIQFEPNPNAIGHFLRGALGQSSGTVLCGVTSWATNSISAQWAPPGYAAGRPVVRHVFNPNQNAFDAITYLPPYSLMMYKDVGSAFLMEGAIFPSVEFQIQAKNLVKATATVMARNPTRIGRPSSVAALKNPGGIPWTWNQASIQTGPGINSLASDPNFESLTIKYETPIEGVSLLDGTTKYGEFQINGFQEISISGTISFRDQLDYDTFVAYGNSALRVALQNTNSAFLLGNVAAGSTFYYQMEMDIPLMKFLTWSTPIQGPNRLTSQFTARAEYDVGSNYAIEIRLTNTTSAYM